MRRLGHLLPPSVYLSSYSERSSWEGSGSPPAAAIASCRSSISAPALAWRSMTTSHAISRDPGDDGTAPCARQLQGRARPRVAGGIVRHGKLHAFLRRWIYREQTLTELTRPALWVTLGVVVVGLLVAVPRDVARTRDRRLGRRLKGPQLLTVAQFNRRLHADGMGFVQQRSAFRGTTVVRIPRRAGVQPYPDHGRTLARANRRSFVSSCSSSSVAVKRRLSTTRRSNTPRSSTPPTAAIHSQPPGCAQSVLDAQR